MVAQKMLPGVDEIKRRLRAGETRTSIAEVYGVTRPAVTRALRQAGEEPGQMRYDHLLPWRVLPRHTRNQYAPKMLRLEGRARNGLELSESDAKKLASWKRELKTNDTVIMYFPDHDCEFCAGEGGFHPVGRKEARKLYGPPHPEFDTELIFVTKEQGDEALKRLS